MLKNMKIRGRLLISYMVITVLLLIVGIVSIVMLREESSRLQEFYDQQFQTVENALDMRRTVFSVRGNILSSIVEYNEDTVDSAKSDFQSLFTLLDELKGTYQGDMSQLTQIEQNLSSAEPSLSQVEDLAKQQQDDEAVALYKSSYKPYMDETRDILVSVGETAQKNALNKVEDGARMARISNIIVIVMICLAVAVSVILALAMSNSIRKPVEEIRQVAANMAKGQMDMDITYHSADELGEMAEHMRELTGIVRDIVRDVDYCMNELAQGNFTVVSRQQEAYVGDYAGILKAMRILKVSMSDTLSQIEIAADQVNAGGEQVSSGSQALAQGATEQASSVQELAATIQDVSGQVDSTASHARTAKSENDHTHQQIGVCSGDMDALMDAMSKIESHSNEISKVINTIEDIAFQTNILALNAAVEAARAGAAGKGFAVVADEVRNLASKSAKAAKSTAVLIEDTVSAVKEGLDLSKETSQALQTVVESSQKVLEAVNLISSATEEEADSLSQISSAVDQISSVVQTNSATAEESAAASEELSGQANVLKELVSRFRLDNSGFAGAPAYRDSGVKHNSNSTSGAGKDTVMDEVHPSEGTASQGARGYTLGEYTDDAKY